MLSWGPLGSELSDNETPFLVILYPDNETKGSDIKSQDLWLKVLPKTVTWLYNSFIASLRGSTLFYLNSSLEFFNVLAELLFAFLFVLELIGNSVDLIFELQFLLLAFLLSLQLAFFVLTNVSHANLFAEVGENSGMKRKRINPVSRNLALWVIEIDSMNVECFWFVAKIAEYSLT